MRCDRDAQLRGEHPPIVAVGLWIGKETADLLERICGMPLRAAPLSRLGEPYSAAGSNPGNRCGDRQPEDLTVARLLREEPERIDQAAVRDHLVVEVIARGSTRCADQRNDVAPLNLRTSPDEVFQEMPIARFKTEAMVNDDQVAVRALPTDVPDRAVCRRIDRLAAFAGNIDPPSGTRRLR